MTRKELMSYLVKTIATATLVLLLLTSAWATSKEKVLYRFAGGSDGNSPAAGLVMDAAGNLYGTTYYGGDTKCSESGHGCGIVFELSHGHNGKWSETVLYKFQGGSDGAFPSALVMDGSGNLYGMTEAGGNLACYSGYGCGTVFKVSPAGGGWTETVLYTFMGNGDGSLPAAGVAFDRAGNLYGTTQVGGGSDQGTVFELSPSSDGTWTENTLYNFNNEGTAYAGVTIDRAGNLYGTTSRYGDSSQVYKLIKSGGVWTESKIGSRFSFLAGVVLDKKGNLYGSDYCSEPAGVGCGYGAVFTLTKSGSSYHETYIPLAGLNGGASPEASVVLDPAGNFYGTTSIGGDGCPAYGCGVVFKFTHSQKGWKETVLHNFHSGPVDGAEPAANVIRDKAGHLYGTTSYGGIGFGVVFEVSP